MSLETVLSVVLGGVITIIVTLVADRIESHRKRSQQIQMWNNWFGGKQPEFKYTSQQIFYDFSTWAGRTAAAIREGRAVPIDEFLPLNALYSRINSGSLPREVIGDALDLAVAAEEIEHYLKSKKSLEVTLPTLEIIESTSKEIARTRFSKRWFV